LAKKQFLANQKPFFCPVKNGDNKSFLSKHLQIFLTHFKVQPRIEQAA
jgi:hypothetical protein